MTDDVAFEPWFLEMELPSIDLLAECFRRQGFDNHLAGDELVIEDIGYQMRASVVGEAAFRFEAIVKRTYPAGEYLRAVDACNVWNARANAMVRASVRLAVDSHDRDLTVSCSLGAAHVAPFDAGISRLQLHRLVTAYRADVAAFLGFVTAKVQSARALPAELGPAPVRPAALPLGSSKATATEDWSPAAEADEAEGAGEAEDAIGREEHEPPADAAP